MKSMESQRLVMLDICSDPRKFERFTQELGLSYIKRFVSGFCFGVLASLIVVWIAA